MACVWTTENNFLKGGFMLSRTIVCLVCIAVLAMMGCGKKENKNKTASLLTQIPKAPQTAAPKDSADIFDEFYDGSVPKTKAAPSTKKEATFSTAATATSTEFTPNGRYVVQVSCVLSRSLADKNVKRLEEKGYPAYVAEVSNPTPALTGTYFRVRIGGFKLISEAKAFGEKSLVSTGYDYWVDNRSNDNVGLSGSGLGSSSTESSYTAPAAPSSSSNWGSTSSASTSASSSTSSSDWGSSNATTTTPSTANASTVAPAAEPSSSATSSGSDDWGNDSAW
jgi:hypothetical protein